MKALKSEEINKVIQKSKKKKPGDNKHKPKENLEIMEKQRTILVKENLEKLVIRLLLKESVCSALKFNS